MWSRESVAILGWGVAILKKKKIDKELDKKTQQIKLENFRWKTLDVLYQWKSKGPKRKFFALFWSAKHEDEDQVLLLKPYGKQLEIKG